MYVFDLRYESDYSSPQPLNIQFRFPKVFPKSTVTGYALVLTKRKLSIDTDGQRQFNLRKQLHL